MAFQTWNVMLSSVLICVVCTDALDSDGLIRLDGRGSSATEGVVQVRIAGEWKNLCGADGWDAVDALVTCRQLGFTNGYAMIWEQSSSRWPATASPTYETEGNDFACNGQEKSLLSCKYTKHNTYCSKLAAVACGITEAKYNVLLADFKPRGDYNDRLSYTVNTPNGISDGRVLSISGRAAQQTYLTGGICDMDERAAMLICYQQGYINGGKKTKVPTIKGLPMLLSKLTCLETSYLERCNEQYTSTGACPDGIRYNGAMCYTTVRPSVIGALAFAVVSSIIIVSAGVCGIRWIRKDPKISHVSLYSSESGPDDDDDDISSHSHSEF